MLSWQRFEVEPTKNVAQLWTRFCSFEKPDTGDDHFLSKVDLQLSSEPRKHEKY